MPPKKLISIVTPCYNEEANVRRHFDEVCAAIAPLRERYDFEHIYTDNVSRDRTFELLSKIAAEHKNVRVMRFSRNIGPNRAVAMGISQAKGDATIVIQADLQDPPELIPDFIKGWEEGYDVVYGSIIKREESALMQAVRRLYYKIIAALSDVPPPANAGDYRLVSRRVLDALKHYHEDDLYFRGAVSHVGYPQKPLPFVRRARAGGETSQGFIAYVAFSINAMLSGTGVAPIRAVVVAGLLIALLGFAGTAFLIVNKLVHPDSAPHGITTLGALITFFAGAQLLAIGVIGEYIRKIYVQSLNRPRGFIADRVNLE